MPKKYSINTKEIAPRFYPVGKYATIEFRENCAGSCKECVKSKCVYNIFKDNYMHMSRMYEPEYLYTCNSCFRCIQECTKGIFSRVINPEYREIGDDYWTPDLLNRTWYQAHTGKIPVSGAGYRGPFIGYGFDSMWTDMSEIVRPTRDGIHGREYINTCVELSRRPEQLVFNDDGSLAIDVKPILEIPLPVVFSQPDFGLLSKGVLFSIIKAAQNIETKVFINASDINEDLMPFAFEIIPKVNRDNFNKFKKLLTCVQMVEIEYTKDIQRVLSDIKAINKNLYISIGLMLDEDNDNKAICAELVRLKQVDTIHIYADSCGKEFKKDNPKFIKYVLRDIHTKLVEQGTRKLINIIASGGIGLAEHVNKAIICGADAVGIDIPLLAAMECRLCGRCKKGLKCPVDFENLDPEYGSQRIINLMGAWRDQMLELLGAMGIREMRRLRGEAGRAMWFEDLEEENFAPIFGIRKNKQVV